MNCLEARKTNENLLNIFYGYVNRREYLKNLYNALYFVFSLDVTISLVLAFVLFGISFTGLIIGSSVLIFFDVVFILYRKKILIVKFD